MRDASDASEFQIRVTRELRIDGATELRKRVQINLKMENQSLATQASIGGQN